MKTSAPPEKILATPMSRNFDKGHLTKKISWTEQLHGSARTVCRPQTTIMMFSGDHRQQDTSSVFCLSSLLNKVKCWPPENNIFTLFKRLHKNTTCVSLPVTDERKTVSLVDLWCLLFNRNNYKNFCRVNY